MKNKANITTKRALIIIAHPDDESIWMGGFIFKHPDIEWTIFSLCRASDKDRAPKFRRVCDYFKAQAIITDLDDEGNLSVQQNVIAIKKAVKENIGEEKFDYIFTHGENGEYGHPGHLAAYQAVTEMYTSNELHTEKLYCFNYKKTGEHKVEAKLYADLILQLTQKEFAQKKAIVSDLYGFNPNGIDVGYCTNPESFKEFKRK